MTRPIRMTTALLASLLAFAVLNGCGSHRYRSVACAQTKSGGSSGGATRTPAPAPKAPSAPSAPKVPTAPKAPTATAPKAPSGTSKPATPPPAQNKTTPTAPKTTIKPPVDPNSPAPTTKANSASAPKSQQSKATPPGEKAYTPPPADVKPPAKQITTAQKSAPQSVSTTGSYRSPVTHHTYVYHDSGYYSSPGYILDIFDPYNPWNYSHNLLSPFYGRPYVLVEAC